MNSSCAPYDFLKVRPTFMDAWPVVWRNLSLPMLLVSIDRVECNALGWQIAGHHHLFEQASPMILSGIVERLDMAIFRMGGLVVSDSFPEVRKTPCERNVSVCE